MTTPTTPVRQPGDPIPPPPEPRYPWRVAAIMLGLVVLVLVVVWLGFRAVRGPETSGQFPTAPTATAYASAFQATVSAADTAEPRPTRPPTTQPAAAGSTVPTPQPTTVVVPPVAPAATSQAGATVQSSIGTRSEAPGPTTSSPQTPDAAGQVESVRTAVPATAEASEGDSPAPGQTVAPELESAVSNAYVQYWQVTSDAFLSLDPTALSQVAAGPQLERLQKHIDDEGAQGQATQVKIDHSFYVVVASNDQAQVADDYRDLSILVDPSTHEPLPGQSVPPVDTAPEHKIVANLQLLDGTWKVVDGAEIVGQENTQ